jgi:hypothetical protein
MQLVRRLARGLRQAPVMGLAELAELPQQVRDECEDILNQHAASPSVSVIEFSALALQQAGTLDAGPEGPPVGLLVGPVADVREGANFLPYRYAIALRSHLYGLVGATLPEATEVWVPVRYQGQGQVNIHDDEEEEEEEQQQQQQEQEGYYAIAFYDDRHNTLRFMTAGQQTPQPSDEEVKAVKRALINQFWEVRDR